jgi:hypothetical protein
MDLHFPGLAALGAEEMGAGGADADEHGTPARILEAALAALLPVVNVGAVLTDEDGPVPGDRSPHPGTVRRARVRTGLALRGLRCGAGASRGNRRDSYRRWGVLIGCPWHFFGRTRRWTRRENTRGARRGGAYGWCWRDRGRGHFGGNGVWGMRPRRRGGEEVLHLRDQNRLGHARPPDGVRGPKPARSGQRPQLGRGIGTEPLAVPHDVQHIAHVRCTIQERGDEEPAGGEASACWMVRLIRWRAPGGGGQVRNAAIRPAVWLRLPRPIVQSKSKER